jgi:malate dehydrogenase
VDAVDGLAEGKALDLNHAAAVAGYAPVVVGTTGYEETSGSRIVVITAGSPRTPGMSRADLLDTNRGVVAEVAAEVRDRSPDAVVIVVTNPLDAMCHVAYEATGFPRERVIGMAGVLDSAVFRTFLAWELGISVDDVTGLVLGAHGDTMVPLASWASAGGIPVRRLIAPDRLDRIVERTRGGGAEVGDLLRTASAYYGPAAAIVAMVDSIVLDQKRVLPCATLCDGEYGVDGLFLGVPVKLGACGVEQIVQVDLDGPERDQLARSADSVRELVRALGD